MGFARLGSAILASKKRELMRAGWRLAIAMLAAGLALGPVPVLAQDATPPPAEAPPPAADAIGPRELQNFSLNGTVTRSAEPAATQRASRPPATATRTTTRTTSAPAAPQPVRTEPSRSVAQTTRTEATPSGVSEAPRVRAERPQRSNAASSVTVSLPPIDESPVATTPNSAAASSSFPAEPEGLGAEHRLALWPWLLAALALGAGGAFLFWRNRTREAFAGGPHFDAFSAPEPVPAPRPVPTPRKAPPPPAIPGVVSTRLRPWIDLAFQPLRCVVEDHQVTIEFELVLQNSGSAPARGVLVEASMFNAGPAQDQAIGAFFANPAGLGERIAVIPPLKNVVVRTKVTAPRENMQLLDIGGRHVFVPLIAFNALYSWSTGEGQTSASYLLGRDTKGEKMAPFRVDLGPRIFRGVGARLLPTTVRD